MMIKITGFYLNAFGKQYDTLQIKTKIKMYFLKPLRENIMSTLNISLPEPMQNWVESQISSGHYADYSDYILNLIRRDQQQNLIVELLIEGENSGESEKTIDDIWIKI
jgi:antitoxin ParD1/3/4